MCIPLPLSSKIAFGMNVTVLPAFFATLRIRDATSRSDPCTRRSIDSKRGHVSSRVGEPTRQQGGRAKRYFAAERSVVEALAQSQALLTGLWDGIELDPERYG